MRPLSIRTRLIFLFTLQIIILLSVGGFYLDWRLRQTLENELSHKLESLARAAALQIDGILVETLTPGDESSRTYRNLKQQLQAVQAATGARRLYLFSNLRTSLVDTRPEIVIGQEYVFLPITREDLDALFAGGTVSSTLFTGEDGKLYQTGFAPVFADGRVVAALALEGSARTLEAIQVVRRDLLLLGLAVLFGSVLLGWLFSRTLITPLHRLKLAAQRIARGRYETPIAIASGDEIGFLGRTMEEMRRAIVQRDVRQKAMLAGVAHEVRNPLGGIELFAGLLAGELDEGDARRQAEKIQQEVQNLKRIVNDFLDYARPSPPNKQLCHVREVFQEAQALLVSDLDDYQVTYREDRPHTRVRADREHLKRVFLNLLKNAVEATPKGGRIDLNVQVERGGVRLLFSDSGPGIPAELRQRVFEPFFTNRKQGTGLGLAIVKTLVEENGGEIRVVDSTEGARFEIWFSLSNS